MDDLPAEVAELLKHGAALRAVLRSRIAPRQFATLCERGQLVPLDQRVMVHPPMASVWTGIAAVQLRHPTCLGAGRLAAWAHRVPPWDRGAWTALDFTCTSHVRDRAFFCTGDLDRGDLIHIGGLRFTSPARTLADLGRFVDDDVVERAGEAMLHRRLTTERELEDLVGRLGRQGRRGVPALARFLGRRGRGTAPTESDLETRFLQVVRHLGFRQPTHRQLEVRDAGGQRCRVDFAWLLPTRRVLVEVDGAAVHANPDALVRDLRRQNSLASAGDVLLRFTADEIDRRPALIGAHLERHLPTSYGPARSAARRATNRRALRGQKVRPVSERKAS